ncbi:IS3 family transposase [Putridiphycobacter roseus]|uniref:IS3 family transposase n=1 Tax=Putridiphycobacter roseus TaxID=2219161 RepID=A0A2W1N965_9FLAO|nr:IS3 family transposase [Putridiphycobacter roseus]PZE15593.1 IS3 family transposase [Putridiphycobacter roseus]
MSYSLNKLYQCVGISKQAVIQYVNRQALFDNNVSQLIVEADILRKAHPGCGVEKMYDTLKPDFIGRDRFIDTFMDLGYRIKRQKNYRRTTYAGSIFYDNLIKGLKVSEPSTIWQSDITYIKVIDRFYYVVLIIDVYTKNIVGYSISNHMRATANIAALNMALKNHKAPQIHHSDRGSQYTSKDYIDLLVASGTKISMGLTAQDNAYAERINRTIKEEFIDLWKPKDFKGLRKSVKKAIVYYNTKRPHRNLNKMSPTNFEKNWSTLNKKSKPIITIFNNELLT